MKSKPGLPSIFGMMHQSNNNLQNQAVPLVLISRSLKTSANNRQ